MPVIEAPREVATDTGRVLVVDDEEDIVRIFRQFLEEQGYEVDSCFNGKDACEKVCEETYDLVITDMVMSPVRGEEVLRAVTEHSPDTEIIVITAFATFERIQEALRRQVFDFVEKPVDLHRLSSVVSAAVGKAKESRARTRLLAQLRERNAQLIEEVQRATENLERETLEDGATGLPGYQAFRSALETEISRAIQSNSPLTLGMLQLEGFSECCRQHGREAAESLLREVAAFLRSSLRKSDALFRYGTDQFAAVFPRSTGEAAAQCIRRVMDEVKQRPWSCVSDKKISPVELKAGLASAPRNGENFDQIVRAANRSLEQAKLGGLDPTQREERTRSSAEEQT